MRGRQKHRKLTDRREKTEKGKIEKDRSSRSNKE